MESQVSLYWKEFIAENLEALDQQAFVSQTAEVTASVSARLIAWQFSDAAYGLGRMGAVQRDQELRSFCEQLVALCRREEAEEAVQDAFSALYGEVAKAWAISGERERVRAMQIARRFAWLGGRKWAWIPMRSWRKTWMWLLLACRPRTRSSITALSEAWLDASVWPVSPARRRAKIQALRDAYVRAATNV